QQDGRFAEEIVPVPVKRGDPVALDEHPRSDASLESLGGLRAVMSKGDPDATVTAGNASGQNDGAAICIVTHAEKAAELGVRPLGGLVACAAAGVPPATMGIGPVPATERALRLAGLELGDLGLIELN